MRSKLTKTELLELLHIYKEEKQELLDEKNALVRTVNHWKDRHDETFLALKNSVKVVEDFEKKIISKYKKLEEKNRSKREDTNKKDFIRTGKNLIPTSRELHRYLVRNYQSIRISKITGERVNNNSGERHYFR